MHNTRALTQKLRLQERATNKTMMLSRARPLALRTLRQQRALSAAPQPVYEPHVVLHQRPDQTPTADAEKNKSGTASAAGYFKTTRHAVDATPEQLDGSPVRENAGPPAEDRRERRPHGVLRRLHGPRHEPHVRAVPGGDALCGNQILGTQFTG